MAREIRGWSRKDENSLLVVAVMFPDDAASRFAQSTGRTRASVRTKLCRLRKDPALRPPTLLSEAPGVCSANTDPNVAPPRVSMTRGSSDTSDGKD